MKTGKETQQQKGKISSARIKTEGTNGAKRTNLQDRRQIMTEE